MIAAHINRWAPLAYFAVALTAVLVLGRLVPLGMVPDEGSHWLRAVQIAQGQWVATRANPSEAGGIVPYGAVEVGEALDELIGHPDVKVDPAVVRTWRDIRWTDRGEGFAAFGNTAIYLPAFYGPAAAAIAFGRWRDWSVSRTFALARAATGIAAVGLCTLAIGIARRGRALLTALLLLPMALLQFSSVSQDALLIAGLALVAGLCSRAASEARPLRSGERFIAFAIIGLAVGSRPPYAPVLLLGATALLGSVQPGGTTFRRFAARLWAPLMGGLIAGGWILFGAGPAKTVLRTDVAVSIPGQLDYLAHHLSVLPALAWNTIASAGLDHYRQFLGIVGWSDVYPPVSVHIAATLTLLGGAALSRFEPGATLNRRDGALVLGLWLAAWVAVYLTLYLAWTAVGAPLVDGVQGRYFLPSATMLALIAPALIASRSDVRAPALAAAGWAAVLLVGAVDAAETAITVVNRFYG